jgi:hypothetical protein
MPEEEEDPQQLAGRREAIMTQIERLEKFGEQSPQ